MRTTAAAAAGSAMDRHRRAGTATRGGVAPAGRRLPTSGTAFRTVRDADKQNAVPVAAALAGLGFKLTATAGTARTLSGAGLDVEIVEKGRTVVDQIRKGKVDLVVNTPQGRGARTDGYAIREAALVARVPCITTLSGASAAVHAIAHARTEIAKSLQERIDEARSA